MQLGDLTVYLQPETEDQIGPGSRLGNGRYTLVRLLGKGGMGEVWLAKDEQLDEEVALKKLPHEVGSDAVALADMRREVQKSRALSHPNIIRIHDLIQQPGEDPLISLEFVDGTDLTAIAATKTNNIFDWADIRDWVLQLVNALEYAHEEKIVHRDLKPGNIMISRNGRLKLADFGIAASVADVTRRSSMAGFISGTTIYMSPQQMEGAAPKETDDIYAFGATIYELLTSRPPFYTGNVEHQVLNVTPTPPSQRLAEFGFMGQIPPYVQELLMACLAKDPSGRPQSMGLIRQWIETEGKAQDIIPKPTTKTIKHSVPVAAAPLPQGVGGKAGNNESNYLWVYIAGAILVLVCFIVGKKMGGGKSDESSAVKPRFQLVEGKFTWEEARKDAIARGGHLATITSQREQQLMENLLSGVKGNNRGVWLGGSNVAGSWEWVTKEQWSYTNWNGPSPNGQNYLAVYATDDAGFGLWEDDREDWPWAAGFGYLMEKSN